MRGTDSNYSYNYELRGRVNGTLGLCHGMITFTGWSWTPELIVAVYAKIYSIGRDEVSVVPELCYGQKKTIGFQGLKCEPDEVLSIVDVVKLNAMTSRINEE